MLASSLQSSLLQRKVPLRRLVGIIDQHQPGVEPQPFRLLDHRLLILLHEPRSKERSNRSYKWDMIEDVPRSVHIDPTGRSSNRSHSSKAGEPLRTATDRLVA